MPWLGEIPEHWQTYKSKYCFSINMGQSPDSNDTNNVGNGLPFLQGNADFGSRHPSPRYFCTNPSKLSQSNDILMSVRAPVGELNIADQIYVIGRGLCALTPLTSLISTEYSWYCLHTFREHLKLFSTGSTYDAVSSADVGQIKIPLPPREEQERIARFLDEKTAAIDAAIAKKERLIALLEEQKGILINTAVTRGLNPHTPLKDSGIPWLGRVPAHWMRLKLKYLINILAGYAFRSTSYSEDSENIRLLRGINISPSQMKWDEVVYWPKEDVADYESYFLQEDDLVIGMDRPWISSGIRVARISKEDLPCLLLQRVARIRAQEGLLQDFLELLLQSNIFLSYFEPMLTGISVPHISTDQISRFNPFIPPTIEQEAICKFVDDIEQRFSYVTTKEREQINLLQEYKATLIASAVTGKIKI